MMNISWQSPESLKQWKRFSHSKFNIATFRKYKELSLIGDQNHDAVELKELTALIKQLTSKADTINGVSISLSTHTQYGEIVGVLDFFHPNENKNISGGPYKDKIFFWYIPSPSKAELASRKGNLDNDEVIYTPPQPFISFEKVKKGITSALKAMPEFWPSVLVFVMMLWFAFYKRKRYLNLKTFHLVDS